MEVHVNHLRAVKSMVDIGPPGGGRTLLHAYRIPRNRNKLDPVAARFAQPGPGGGLPAALQHAPPMSELRECAPKELHQLASIPRGGRPGAAKLLGDLYAYAEAELKTRGVSRDGHSEARLAVWREVFTAFTERLPTYRQLLARVASEYDLAIKALRAQIDAANLDAATAWSEQQKVETKLVGRQQELRAAESEAAARADEEAATRARQMLEPAWLVSTLTAADEAVRFEVIAKTFAGLSAPKRVEVLGKVQRRLPTRERAAFAALVLKAGGGGAADRASQRRAKPPSQASPSAASGKGGGSKEGGGDSADPGVFSQLEQMTQVREGLIDDPNATAAVDVAPEPEALAEALLDELPERMRLELGVRALKSLTDGARSDAMRGLEDWEKRRAAAQGL